MLYQPIFDLDSRNCRGRGLLRWRRPDGSLTSPDLFIPMAENTGQIRQMTDRSYNACLSSSGKGGPTAALHLGQPGADVMIPRIGQ